MNKASAPTQLLSVMAGFFPDNSVPETTRIWIQAIQSISQRVVLVFDNPEPVHCPASWQSENCKTLFESHGEYDFGSYKRGLQWAEQKGWLESASHVLFFNDSVYGPISELKRSIKPMLQQTDQAWGLTESNQITPHLQSFFLILGSSILKKPAIQQIFKAIAKQKSRQEVIEKYELGLSKALLAEGISLNALLPAKQNQTSCSGERMINPTAWPLSAVELGLPVLKKRALLEEFSNQEGFTETCRMVARRNPRLWQAILAESPHWKLWGEHLKLGILWQDHDIKGLHKKLAFLREQLNCNWSVVLPINLRERNLLPKNLDEAIKNNELVLVKSSPDPGDVLEALLDSDHDWLVVASKAAWDQPHRWALLQRQLIQQPDRDVFPGDPVTVRRRWWLKQGASMKALHKYQHDPIQLSPILNA